MENSAEVKAGEQAHKQHKSIYIYDAQYIPVIILGIYQYIRYIPDTQYINKTVATSVRKVDLTKSDKSSSWIFQGIINIVRRPSKLTKNLKVFA